MVRGTIKFVCDDCGCKFIAPDIRFMESDLSTPQQCPNCGKHRTRPKSFLGLNRWLYEKIWDNDSGENMGNDYDDDTNND